MTDEKTIDAVADLEAVEEEALREAEASVEAADKMGDEEAAAEAAETAGEFIDAEVATAEELAEL